MGLVEYRLRANTLSSSAVEYVYKYSTTKDIHLFISRDAFAIEVKRWITTPSEEILNDKLFIDGIRKAELIHTVYYGTTVKIRRLTICIDDEESTIFSATENNPYVIYSLFGEKLSSSYPKEWRTQYMCNSILTIKKDSDEYRLIAALYALTMAKSKQYAAEKFMYLWMAMNGLYGYIAQIAKQDAFSDNEKQWINREYGQLKFFSIYLGYEYNGIAKEKESIIRNEMEALIGKTSVIDYANVLSQIKNNEANNGIVAGIHKALSENSLPKSDPYVLLLIWLSYQIRCKYFHSELSLPVFCFYEEKPLPTIKFLNYLLESFLDENLLLFFNSKLLEREIQPIIRKYIRACRCNRNGRLISIDIKEEAYQ